MPECDRVVSVGRKRSMRLRVVLALSGLAALAAFFTLRKYLRV